MEREERRSGNDRRAPGGSRPYRRTTVEEAATGFRSGRDRRAPEETEAGRGVALAALERLERACKVHIFNKHGDPEPRGSCSECDPLRAALAVVRAALSVDQKPSGAEVPEEPSTLSVKGAPDASGSTEANKGSAARVAPPSPVKEASPTNGDVGLGPLDALDYLAEIVSDMSDPFDQAHARVALDCVRAALSAPPQPEPGHVRCAKCASTDVYVRFYANGEYLSPSYDEARSWGRRLPPTMKPDLDGFTFTADVLACICRTCGWRWTTTPVGAGSAPQVKGEES